MSKKLISAVAAATLGASAIATPAFAEVTATAGVMSDYVFRGASSNVSAANGSVDWASDNGLSAGVWAIDDANGQNDGLEFDVYAAYGMDMDSFSWSLGYTSYQYTYDSVSQNEVNVGLAAGDFSLAVDIGNQADDVVAARDDIDYQHVGLSWAANDVYTLSVGNVDPNTDSLADDDTWTYFEVTAGGEIAEVDVSMTLGHVEEDDLVGSVRGYMVLSASKTFDDLGL